METQLKGSKIQLGKIVKEVTSLKVQLEGKDNDITQIPLPECKNGGLLTYIEWEV